MSTDLTTSPPPTPSSGLAPAITHPATNPKYPHTRALLASLARQYRPADDLASSPISGPAIGSDGESEGEFRDPISSLGGNEYVRRVVGYVRDEDEGELRKTLRESFGDGTDFDTNIDAHVLELMHKHHNDVMGVPFSVLTPIKRPQNLSRPSSRASQHSYRSGRPETPTLLSQSGRAGSFSARGRPHTPVSASRLTSVFLQAHANSALSGEESDGGGDRFSGIHGPGSTFSDSPTPSPRLGSVRMPAARPLLPTSLSSSDLASAGAASPSSSPRYLNAKALEFRPTGSGRPLSAMSGSFSASGASATHGRESPGESLWAHGGTGSGSEAGLLTPSVSSKLAIAAPLLPDHSRESPVPSPLAASFRAAGKGIMPVQEDDDDDDSRPGTPASHDATPVKSNTAINTPTSTAGGIRMRPRSDTLDDEEFSPFFIPSKGQAANGLLSVPYGCSPYDVESGGSSASASSPGHSFDIPGQMNMLGVSSVNPYATSADDEMGVLTGQFGRIDMLPGTDDSPPSDDDLLHLPSQYLMGGLDEDGYPLPGPYGGQYGQGGEDGMGMTPMEMLVQMFGSTASEQELEQALQENGYDFEGAIATLVDRQNGAVGMGGPGVHNGNGAHHVHPRAHPQGAGRVLVLPREEYGRMANGGRISPRYGMMGPGPGARSQGVPNRVCRYFLQGECRRADCRFSHDIERALCRFWLRGQCAKGEQCEFVHEIPPGWDQQQVQAVIAANRAGASGSRPQTPQGGMGDDFPQLGRRGSYPFGAPRGGFDPSRSRFASAVKGPSGNRGYGPHMAVTGRQFMVTPGQRGPQDFIPQSAYDRLPQPRQSNRLRLRPPSLLPTLPTGPSVNQLYMQYRNRAHQLAATRNANLTKAANAWRSHDGAAAKSFSRAAADLNARMQAELAHSARLLVKERAKIAQDAVRNREMWAADDAADRTSRGRPCGNALGVILGVAREGAPTPEERMECVLDLHALHANEGQEILEEFLAGLEHENYLGLAYVVVGEEKHTASNDPARGSSKLRLASGVKEYLHQFAYAWNERDGVVWVDPLTHVE